MRGPGLGKSQVIRREVNRESEPLIGAALSQLTKAGRLRNGDQIVIVSSIAAGTTHADAIQMRTIGEEG